MDAVTKCGRGAGGGGGVTAIVEYDYTAKEPDELDLVKGALIQNIKKLAGGWWEGTLQATGKAGMFPDNFVRLVDLSDDNTVVLREKSATTNRRCKVIYSYIQVNEDELSLAVGDVIEFLGEVEEGWWRGRLKNKIGVFPSNFVVAIEPSPIFATKRVPSSSNATTMTVTSSTSKSSTAATTNANAATAAGASSSTINAAVNNISSSGGSSKKKTNRLSLHSSKEDLLSSTTSSSATTKVTSSVVAATNASGDDVAPSLPPKPQREFCRVEFPYMPQNDDELYLRAGDIITIISTELPDKGWWKGELRGKVGVFPDNFVKLLPAEVSPLNDAHFSAKAVKNSNAAVDSFSNAGTSLGGTSLATAAHLMNNSVQSSTTTATTTATTKTNHTATATSSSSSSSSSSKAFVKKSAVSSSSSTQSTQGQGQSAPNRKESFGSRDSLNDILSETGLQSGNVAAARKSLENKNIDLLNVPDAGGRPAVKKVQQQQHTTTTVTSEISSSSSTSASATTIMGGGNSEMRKSLENLDEKTKTPPPVLTKKPLLGAKGILSGLKQKVKNVEKQLTSAASHDYADGISASKASASNGGGLPDACAAGNVIMRRAATIAVEDTDFDSVERTSILPDMRAGRVKAPRRRPPSVAYNTSGESNNNSTAYVNGGVGGGSGDGSNEESLAAKPPHSSDDNSTGDELLLAKPKPREWQTQKAPWMEELKLSQVKKKASPNVEKSTTTSATATATTTEKTRMSSGEDTRISGGSPSSNAFSFSNTTSSSSCSSAAVTATATKVQSSSVSSSVVQQSMLVESSQQQQQQQQHMSKSMLIKGSADTTEDMRTRPNSLSIRNRSSSPSSSSLSSAATATAVGRSSVKSSTPAATSNTIAAAETAGQHTTTASSSSSLHTNNHTSAYAYAPPTSASASALHDNNLPVPAKHNHPSLTNSISNINSNSNSNSMAHSNHAANPSMMAGINTEGARVWELERRVEKLEAAVYAQQRTIDELVRTLREEADRIKVLRGELDKYAQCVTQV